MEEKEEQHMQEVKKDKEEQEAMDVKEEKGLKD